MFSKIMKLFAELTSLDLDNTSIASPRTILIAEIFHALHTAQQNVILHHITTGKSGVWWNRHESKCIAALLHRLTSTCVTMLI